MRKAGSMDDTDVFMIWKPGAPTLLKQGFRNYTITIARQGGRERSSHGSLRFGVRVQKSVRIASRITDDCRSYSGPKSWLAL